MKATGIVRRIDDLGRVVIPKEIRRTMRIREGDPSQMTLEQWEKFCFAVLALSKRWGWMVHNNEKLRPCPMLENPELLPKMVAQSGAHSTDLEAPESAEHLCEKCKAYAACRKPEAEKLWAEEKHNG